MIKDIIECQENFTLKIVPKLTKKDFSSGTYAKLKRNKSVNVLSRNTSSTLTFMAEETSKTEYYVTEKFFKVVSKWFTIIIVRHPKVDIGKMKGDKVSEKKFAKLIEFLESVIDCFQNMKVGNGNFKPLQRGVVNTTKTVIDLNTFLIEQRG